MVYIANCLMYLSFYGATSFQFLEPQKPQISNEYQEIYNPKLITVKIVILTDHSDRIIHTTEPPILLFRRDKIAIDYNEILRLVLLLAPNYLH